MYSCISSAYMVVYMVMVNVSKSNDFGSGKGKKYILFQQAPAWSMYNSDARHPERVKQRGRGRETKSYL